MSSKESKYYEDNCKEICTKYRGLWIAILKEKVIASDNKVGKLYEKIRSLRKTPLIMFIQENEVHLI